MSSPGAGFLPYANLIWITSMISTLVQKNTMKHFDFLKVHIISMF